MKNWQVPSGLQRGIPFLIQDDWSAEQALAVVELLDDLREVIWARYQIPLYELLHEQRCGTDDSISENIRQISLPF